MRFKKNKYRAKKTVIDGHTFDSLKESRRYVGLKTQEKVGYISKLKIQPRFDIKVNGQYIAFYKADFQYIDSQGETVIEDVKSPITAKNPVYRLKKKLVEALYPIKIREI